MKRGVNMGSPISCYRQILVEYIRVNVRTTKLNKKFSEDFLFEQSTEELERLVKNFNRSNHVYAAYIVGNALANCMKTFCNDELNASCAVIDDFLELMKIREPEFLDYAEIDEMKR